MQVSAAIMFDAGVVACLEYLEAIPWSEGQEEEVISVLKHLEFHESVAEVLKRVLVEPSNSLGADAIFLQLLTGVLQAKDEKARQEMKALIAGLLKEDTDQSNNIAERLDVSRETLYHLCHRCLKALHYCLSEAATMSENHRDRGTLIADIAREADNMHWLVEILINKKLADEFVMVWADQTQIAALHPKVSCIYRYEISRITAQLCIAIGKGEILVSKEARHSLLQTWLEAIYNDFSWMKRACRTLNKNMIEDGLCKTILTLPMAQQQTILLRWFDRFLKKGDDCPNLQRAFEVWWRRTFVRRYEREWDQSELQIAV